MKYSNLLVRSQFKGQLSDMCGCNDWDNKYANHEVQGATYNAIVKDLKTESYQPSRFVEMRHLAEYQFAFLDMF